MMIHVGTDKKRRTLQIEGDMNIYSAAELKRQLMDCIEKTLEIEIDLSQISDMDTAGLQVLYLAKREANRSGKTLRLVSHSPAVLEVMDLYNMGSYFGDPRGVLPTAEERPARQPSTPRHKKRT